MATNYISQEATIAAIEYEELKACHQPILMSDIYKAVRNVPSADVRPVVRGKWTQGGDGCEYCSECKYCMELDGYTFNFCPNCGADMRGEQDAE